MVLTTPGAGSAAALPSKNNKIETGADQLMHKYVVSYQVLGLNSSGWVYGEMIVTAETIARARQIVQADIQRKSPGRRCVARDVKDAP